MATPNRAALISKLHKVLKKHYTPVAPVADRPALEQLLYACCLENAHYAAADEGFKALQSNFFDWNEVRVSTVAELAESLKMLPEPGETAAHVRRILQVVFESTYSFDLEPLKKQNLGPATVRLQKMEGTTPFVVAYGVQTALGGHSIPLDRGALEALYIVGLITPAEQQSGEVAGLERAIPKNKGIEFGSLLHQLGAELVANPFSTNLHKILFEIAPESKDRLPKRQAKKPEPEPAKKPAPAAKESKDKPPVAPGVAKEKPVPAPPPTKDKPAAAANAKEKPAPAKEKPAEPPKKPTIKKPAPAPAASSKAKDSVKKKSATSGLSKRKPR